MGGVRAQFQCGETMLLHDKVYIMVWQCIIVSNVMKQGYTQEGQMQPQGSAKRDSPRTI